jgi:hypothetical protein
MNGRPMTADDDLRRALEQITALQPKGPFLHPTDELAEAQGIARAALAARSEPDDDAGFPDLDGKVWGPAARSEPRAEGPFPALADVARGGLSVGVSMSCARCGKRRDLYSDGTCWPCAIEYRDEIIEEYKAADAATPPAEGPAEFRNRTVTMTGEQYEAMVAAITPPAEGRYEGTDLIHTHEHRHSAFTERPTHRHKHATPPAEGLVLVRKDSGGVFPDGTTNHPAIDFDAPNEPATPPAEGHVHEYGTVDVIGHPGVTEQRCYICAATPPAEGLDVEQERDTERIRDPKAWWAGYLAGYRARSREYAAVAPEQPE